MSLARTAMEMTLAAVAPTWLTGPSTMSAFPIWSAVDMVMGSDSHNLFPIEWFLYGVFSLFGLAGAGAGRWGRRRLRAVIAAHRPKPGY